VHRLFEEKNKKVMAAPIGALYYSMIYGILDRYEQLLTAIELTITNFEQRTFIQANKKDAAIISQLQLRVMSYLL
jgi:magnesium transporter